MNFIKFSRTLKILRRGASTNSKFNSFKFYLADSSARGNLNRIFSLSLYVKEYNFKTDINFDLKEKRCKIKDETY